MKRAATPWPLGILATVVLLLIIGIALPVFNTNNLRSPVTKQCDKMGQIWLALHLYAGDNDDKLPPKLSDLSPTYLQPEMCQFHDPQTGKSADWIYYPGHTLHDPADTILVASPVPVAEKTGFFTHMGYRIITKVGASTEVIPDPEFQRRINATPPPR